LSFDDRYLAQLTAESDALEAGALRALPIAITQLTALRDDRERTGFRLDRHTIDSFTDSRRRLLHQLGIAAHVQRRDIEGSSAALVLGTLAPPVFAEPRSSVEAAVLTTASTLEGTAITVHQAILASASTAGDPTIRGLARACIAHHERHRMALDAQLVAVGGRARDGDRPAYLPSIAAPVTRAMGASELVAQAALLEGLVAQTYRSDLASVGDGGTRQFLEAIADVADHHGSCLHVLGSLEGTDLLGRRAPSPAGPALVQLPAAQPRLMIESKMASPRV
jgi:hypothetical protein